MSPRRRTLAAVFVLCFSVWLPVAAGAAQSAPDRVVVETRTGSHEFTVEMAVTPRERGTGLMFRRSLAPDHGMLFDFGRDQEVTMWMENTYIPLDMIFLTADGTVHRIARDTTPHSREQIPSRGPVRAVLEISAGGAERIGLRRGDVVRHPMFSN